MRNEDNWGWRARFGMFIVANEAVPEAEWWAMAPAGISVHAARVTAKAPWVGRVSGDRPDVELADDVDRGTQQFAAMQLDAVVIGHSSSSILGGPGWDQAAIEALSRRLPGQTKVTTNGLDCEAALRACRIERPLLVFPPWFDDAAVAAGRSYFEALGFTASAVLRPDPGPGWRELQPGELYGQGMAIQQDVESTYRQIRDACPGDADGILIAGTGFRCVSIIAALEHDLGRPVVTANQASLWRCLRLSGVQAKVSGYGTLLET